MEGGEIAKATEPDPVEERIEAKRLEVQKVLVDWLGQIEVDREGVFSFPIESTRVFIRIRDFRDSTVISIEAPTNLDVPPTAELFRHVALHADEWLFGHLGCREEDGNVTILFSHRLLGDHLQPEELRSAVGAVAFTANQIDEGIKQQFGGRLFAQVIEGQEEGSPQVLPQPEGGPVGVAGEHVAAAAGSTDLRPDETKSADTPEAGYL